MIVVIIIGGCLIWFGVGEYRIGRNSSAEPVDVDLADLEAGKPLPGNHVRFGLNHLMFRQTVYQYPDDGGQETQATEIDWAYVPIISDSHPYMVELRALDEKYGGRKKIPKNANWPKFNDFAVLLKTEYYKTRGDLPDGRKAYDSATGLIINKVDPLSERAQELIREDFPNTDFDKVLILEQHRKPMSVAASLSVAGVGVLMVFGPIGLLIRRGRGGAKASAVVAPVATPTPTAAPAPTQDDPNPYSSG